MRQSVSNIIRETSEKHRVSIADLMGPCRRRYIAHPRQEAMFRVFTECPHISYPECGRRIGGRDHTTILHGVREHCKRIGLTYDEARAMRSQDQEVIQFQAAALTFGLTMKAALSQVVPETTEAALARMAFAYARKMENARAC